MSLEIKPEPASFSTTPKDLLSHVYKFCDFGTIKCLRSVSKYTKAAVNYHILQRVKASLNQLLELKKAIQSLDNQFKLELTDLTQDIQSLTDSLGTLENKDFTSLLKLRKEYRSLYKQAFNTAAFALQGKSFNDRAQYTNDLIAKEKGPASSQVKLLRSAEKLMYLEGFILKFDLIPLPRSRVTIERQGKPIPSGSKCILMASVCLKANSPLLGELYTDSKKKLMSDTCYVPIDQLVDINENDIVKFNLQNDKGCEKLKIKFCQLKWSNQFRLIASHTSFKNAVDLFLFKGQ